MRPLPGPALYVAGLIFVLTKPRHHWARWRSGAETGGGLFASADWAAVRFTVVQAFPCRRSFSVLLAIPRGPGAGAAPLPGRGAGGVRSWARRSSCRSCVAVMGLLTV